MIVYPSDDFATSVCQMTFPFSALIAIKYPSKLPKKSVFPKIARPRFTLPQHTGRSSGSVRAYFQISVPVFASKAMTLAGGTVKNITPPTTSGVDSYLASSLLNCLIQRTRRFETFAGVISLSGEYRHPLREPEYVNHSPGLFSYASICWLVTSGIFGADFT